MDESAMNGAISELFEYMDINKSIRDGTLKKMVEMFQSGCDQLNLMIYLSEEQHKISKKQLMGLAFLVGTMSKPIDKDEFVAFVFSKYREDEEE